MQELAEHYAVIRDGKIESTHAEADAAVTAAKDGAVVARVKPIGVMSAAGFLMLRRKRG